MNAKNTGGLKGGYLLAAPIILVCLISAAYSNTFHVPFYLDDITSIVENKAVHLKEFHSEGLWRAIDTEGTGLRPVATVSFALNYLVSGLNPPGWHLVNLIVHILSSLVLFLLIKITLDGTRFRIDKIVSIRIALVSTLLWGLHPLQTQSVTYIVQRMSSMATLFYLTAFLCYVLGTRMNGKNQASLAYGFCFFFWLLALGTKETSVMMPFALLLYDNFFGPGDRQSNKRKKILGIISAFFLVAGIMVLIALWPVFGKTYAELRNYSVWVRLLTESRVFFYYLALLIFPFPSMQNLDHDFTLSSSIAEPMTTFLSVMLIMLLLWGSVCLFRRRSPIGFALLWFVLHLMIESTLLPLEVAFEHRLYLPSAGLIGAAVPSVLLGYNKRLVHWFFYPALLLLAVATHNRNELWRDPVAFNRDIVSKSPENARALVNLADILRIKNDEESAFETAKRAIDAKHVPRRDVKANGYLVLGMIYASRGEYGVARAVLDKALEIDNGNPKTRLTYGLLELDAGFPSRAMAHLSLAVRRMPEEYGVWGALAAAAYQLGRYEDALAWGEKTLALNPSDVVAMTTLGDANFALSNYDEAERRYAEAIELGHYTEKVLNKRARCWMKKGEYEKAAKELERLVRQYPEAALFRESLCESRQALGFSCEAGL